MVGHRRPQWFVRYRADGEPVEDQERAHAIEAAQSQEWPSWYYGPSPITARRR